MTQYKYKCQIPIDNRERFFLEYYTVRNREELMQCFRRMEDCLSKELYVHDISFEKDEAVSSSMISFKWGDIDELVLFMSEISMTHSIMFTKGNCIYVTESKDMQTNIDSEVIDIVVGIMRRKLKNGSI